ncbi:MAG: dTDP-4-dehydrorhamnose 3,5-epimerase [Heliobacteriaceae bacterium]|nr:dTDP-4-dehydrorhamnose 3,5-epimerase [Heliobacteriaceae bacterium]MDD4587580.1 dTDP-4-dehydrorhamnose 3,5-epimerase [Heliobacteriaceae bacterium]
MSDLKLTNTNLPGVVIIEPAVFSDSRGVFLETWHRERFVQAGLPATFVQDNLSYSRHGVLRGLHYQFPEPQGKLVSVLQGEVYDVAVDIRRGSPTFGRWVGVILSGANKRRLYIPAGFAHGFYVTGNEALFAYKCTAYYNPATEQGICWHDPLLAITWPNPKPLLSPKDQGHPALNEINPACLPTYGGNY